MMTGKKERLEKKKCTIIQDGLKIPQNMVCPHRTPRHSVVRNRQLNGTFLPSFLPLSPRRQSHARSPGDYRPRPTPPETQAPAE